ncbi:glycosyltransferase [Camelimonas fluminis]|uniref:Glycosyltransferase n=1 Tax=Camelimonas fluminis TaxID=1576911 RepID=A0ABV7UMX3_9HYPH|nr:glycosyltransferase family 2 protein [Camelimonas fluminis]
MTTRRPTGAPGHPVDLARALAKRLLPLGARDWLRRRLTPFAGSNRLARRLLGAGGASYRYVSPERPADLAEILAEPGPGIRFSIVTPTWNTPPALLEAMIRSVQAQWYPHWQLILADDASPSPETRAALAQISDPRVQVLFTEQNGGISAATNRAIAAATGDYIVFLDHDDELTVDCLYELARAIRDTDADYLYSDEDKLSPRGWHFEPFFKPDWSPDTLMSIMYTCHVSCVRRSLLDETGLLRSEFDGSQDWDLVLRITEKAQRIVHIPRVLYHWRVNPGSAAGDQAAKPYAIDAGKRVREDALARRGISGALEPLREARGFFRVRPHMQGAPLISIVIPSKNNGRVLGVCLESIRTKSSYQNVQIVVLDNGTTDAATLQMLEEERRKDVKVIRHDAPFNYSELNNIGAHHSDGELLLFLNDDTEVMTPDWLERMAGFAQLSHIGAVGAKLLYPQSRGVQHVGVINSEIGPVHASQHERANRPGYFLRNVLEYNWLAVTGACLMITRTKFDAVGGFNEQLPVAYNDVDLCFRLYERGYYNIVATAAELLHYESVSRGNDLMDPAKRARLDADREKLYGAHPDLRNRDPFYNPNFHPRGAHFELAG